MTKPTDLTASELVELRTLADEAANTAGGASADAYDRLHRRVTEIAQEHGLDEGPWGADLNDGFLFR